MFKGLKEFVRRRRRLTTILCYGVFNAVSPATAAVLAVFYASQLSYSDYGRYGVLNAILALLCIAIDLGMPNAIVRAYFKQRPVGHSTDGYLTSIVRGSQLLSLFLLPLLGSLLVLLSDVLRIADMAVVPLLLIAAYFDRSAETFAGICRAAEKPGIFALGRAVAGIGTLASAFELVYQLRWGVMGAVLAIAIGRFVTSLTFAVTLSNQVSVWGWRFNWSELREFLAVSLPLAPNRLALWGRQAALQPVLSQVVPLSSVGLFTFATSVSAVPNLLSAPIDLALAPVYFRLRASGEKDFRAKMKNFSVIYLGALFPVWVSVLIFCPNIIGVATDGRFAGATPACALLLCATFVRIQQMFLGRQVLFLGRTWVLPLLSIPSAIFSIAITVTLAGRFGIVVAAFATLAAELFLFVGLAFAISLHEELDYSLRLGLSLVAILFLLAIWIAAGEPFVEWRIPWKIALAVLSFAVSIRLWVWPNREFVYQLAAG